MLNRSLIVFSYSLSYSLIIQFRQQSVKRSTEDGPWTRGGFLYSSQNWVGFDKPLLCKSRKYTAKVGQDNVNIGVVTIFQLANTGLLHSINLKKAGVGQPKYCNNAYVHFVLTNLCSIFSIIVLINRGTRLSNSPQLSRLLIFQNIIITA